KRSNLSESWMTTIAKAKRGPTPDTVFKVTKVSRSSSLAKPNSVSEFSRTTRCVAIVASSPTRSRESVSGVAETDIPTPLTSITAKSRFTAKTVPRSDAITSTPSLNRTHVRHYDTWPTIFTYVRHLRAPPAQP